MSIFSKISAGLKKTRDSMQELFDGVFSGSNIDDSFYDELEEALLLADAGVSTASAVCDELRKRVKAEHITEPEQARETMQQIIAEMLSGAEPMPEGHPLIILMIGVNGVGKTTTIGKIAKRYTESGKRVVMAAADTFRAAAIEQLEVWAERSGAELIKHTEGSDPAAVVFDAIAAGKARKADVVICDTAGRLHNKKGLMDELSKIGRVIAKEAEGCPVETLLVLDATTGQNALNQAREFQNACGLTGIVLTKLDGTARGGVVIGIRRELGIPIRFIGVGEQADDLQPFNAEDFAKALFAAEEK
ncbi:MAG TPA: signal recognition particle-docking protein FtsY [Oscillospiraceae bacterium]|nr:signal recognition particle-docking protein FtsY [Oscillospiraceae bacterium]HRW56985.1 signal recognition particle-docking protein FtsY [Oscillospiraceae bacterium]